MQCKIIIQGQKNFEVANFIRDFYNMNLVFYVQMFTASKKKKNLNIQHRIHIIKHFDDDEIFYFEINGNSLLIVNKVGDHSRG